LGDEIQNTLGCNCGKGQTREVEISSIELAGTLFTEVGIGVGLSGFDREPIVVFVENRIGEKFN
jgi:hypothetical protein